MSDNKPLFSIRIGNIGATGWASKQEGLPPSVQNVKHCRGAIRHKR